MKIFNGKKKAKEILENVKKKIADEKTRPVLAVISAGRNLASELFIKNKKNAAKEIGIKIIEYKFSGNVKEKEIIEKIRELNENDEISGIIVQLPLPEHFNAEAIIKEIVPEKDVDGFGPRTKFQPPLISAILDVLKESAEKNKTRKILAIVNSDIFGTTLRKRLTGKGLKAKYLLSKDVINEKDAVEKADIIITALGLPKFVKGDMIKKGAILIDAGIIVSNLGKVIGDVDRESVSGSASFLTPVPGGIGPLTVAFLLKNVYFSAEKQGSSRREGSY